MYLKCSTIRYQSTYTKSFKVSLYAAHQFYLLVELIVTSPETEAPPKIKGVVICCKYRRIYGS
jgi:hypothetical protein